MFRHRVDSIGKLLPKPTTPVIIDYVAQVDALVKYPLIDTIPSGDTNLSVDTSVFIAANSSIKFTAGYLNLGTIQLPNIWSFETWFYPTSNSSPLFSIGSVFGVTYRKSTNQFEIKRELYSGQSETIYLPATLNLNTWSFISLVREYNVLTLYVGLEKITETTGFYFPIKSGTGYLGKVNTSTFTGNFTNFKLTKENTSRKLLNLDALKNPLQEINGDNDFSTHKLLHLDRKELINSSAVIPSTATYDPLEKAWLVNNTGLTIIPRSLAMPTVYTLDFVFQLGIVTSNTLLFSNWYGSGNRFYYLTYELLTNKIKFTYYKQSTNSVITVELGQYIPSIYNYFALQVYTDKFELFLNGIKTLAINEVLVKPITARYSFNSTVDGNLPVQNNIKVKQFTLTKAIKYPADYLPYLATTGYLRQRKIPYQVKYHQLENRYQEIDLPIVDFNVTSFSSIDVNVPLTLTITQVQSSRYPTNYIYSLDLVSKDTNLLVTKTPSTVAIVTLPADSLTTTFTIQVNINNIQYYKPKFKLTIANFSNRKESIFEVNETRTVSTDTLTSISGYLDGYLSKQSITAGTIPNLSASKSAITSATQYSDAIYGTSYLIDSVGHFIDLTETINNIRTVVLVYKELSTVANRVYVGSSNGYTFNGGIGGELVGDLVVGSEEYTTAFEQTLKISNTKISGSSDRMVAIDETNNRILVYGKNTNGTWNSTPTELNTSITEEGYLQGVSIAMNDEGTAIAFGFKNASNGEGVVQIWKLVGTTWTKDLHISSPVPSPSQGAFGYQVAINQLATRLIVSELGSNKLYTFDKTSIWSNTPDYTISGTGRLGYSLSANSDCTLLAATAADSKKTFIYRFSSGWTNEQEISFGELCKIHPTANLVLLSQISTAEVKVYEKISSTWSQIKSFSNGGYSLFGFAIDLDNDKNVYIASPQQKAVTKYIFSTSWNTTIDFTAIGIGEYGYTFSASTNSLSISNYLNLLRVITREGGALPQSIINVRQGRQNKPLNTPLENTNPQILTFQSNVGLSVDKIGKGLQGNSLNGLFLGALFYNRILTTAQLRTIEDFLTRYLLLENYSLF